MMNTSIQKHFPLFIFFAGIIFSVFALFLFQFSTSANSAEIHEENISIIGTIGNDIIAIGNDIILENKNIAGDIFIIGNSIEVRNIEVSNDANIYAEKIIFHENVKINGNFTYSGKIEEYDTEKSLESIVAGNITQKNENSAEHSRMNIFHLEYNKFLIFGYLTSLILFSFILSRYIPKYFENIIQTIRSKTLSSFVFGASWIITAPLISLLLFLTIIGVPFGITLLSIWLLSLFLLPYLLTSTGTALLLKLFKWDGFFATLVVSVLSALVSLIIFTSPILLIIAPFLFGAMILEKKLILKQYK